MTKTSLWGKLHKKRGSSLPMVVAVGSALVIWVLALMPLIVTHGSAAIATSKNEEKYLDSRSTIEFAKSELYNMVREYVPYTFAVIDNGDGEYSSVIKAKSADYKTYVNTNADDMKDVPKDSDNGNRVRAICAVIPPLGSDRNYNIRITTYENQKAGMTYNTTYTVPVGTLVIHPESYKKTQALPMSDYILVDGKVGSTVLWNSSITTSGSGLTYNNYFDKNSQDRFLSYKDSYSESLLSLDDKGAIQADIGKYTGVFKATADAALLENETPKPQYPATGSAPLTIVEEPEAPSCKVESTAKNNNGSFTVTLTNCGSNALYCYSKTPDATGVNWQISNTFTLTEGGSYYFFCYTTGHADGSTLYGDSKVAYAGYTYLYNFSHNSNTAPVDGGKYIMYTYTEDRYSNRTYTALNANGGSLGKETITEGLNIYSESDTKTWDAIVTEIRGGSWYTGYYYYYEYEFKNGDKWLDHYSFKSGWNSSTNAFRLGEQQILSYSESNNTLYAESGKNKYYLSITGNNFCSTSQSKVYFFPFTESPSEGEVTLPERLSNGINSMRDKTVDEGTTQSEITELYTVSGGYDLKIYLDPSPTPAGYEPLPGTYTVYATWKNASDISLFGKLGTLTVNDVEEEEILRGSGIRGSSLYFMGKDAAFNTNEATVYIEADLLVIRAPLISESEGSVVISPYKEGEAKSLVFFVSGIKSGDTQIFKPYCFYEVPSGTDLTKVTATKAAEWLCKDTAGDCVDGSKVTYKADGTVDSVIFPKALLYLESFGIYPTIDLDIAYATDEQLAHVVSGEAIGWTKNGVLSGTSNADNAMYVVCPYITSVSGNVNYSANRILLTTQNNELSVPDNLTFYCRYLSIDCANVIQAKSTAVFKINNLTTNTTFLDWINKFLGDIDYNSNTLQVDYEKPTTISMNSGNEVHLEAQICRYKSGTNLFEAPEGAKQELQVAYTTDEFNDTFKNRKSKITVIERYMDIGIENDKELNFATFSLFGWSTRTLNLYTNYISLDKEIDLITLYAPGFLIFSGSAEMMINSQETGYTENEYLFFFKTTSADSYTGTMIFVEEDITVVMYGSTVTLSNGFYFIPAKDGGTKFSDIVKNQEKYSVDPEDLNTYSNYIQTDGSISDSYVDTGLENSDAILGGFGGGTIN